jgi:hypothetical protein
MSSRRSFLYGFLAIVASGMIVVPALVFAASSTNFDVNQERGGPVEYTGGSTNYDIKAEIGHPGVGQSTSTNFVFDHGTIWFFSATGINLSIQWAVPELRVGATSTNDDATFYLTLHTPGDADNVIVESMAYLATTSVDGTYSATISFTATPGIYDVGIKTHQHLRKILQDVTLSAGTTTVLNFTNATNTVGFYGPLRMLGGDISDLGTSTSTLGDDVVNSVDLSIILPELDLDDPTGNAIRSNLNQDVVINSVDLSIMLKNLDQNGEQ